jgi:5'(3')-deoxyribonucleotidase
MDLAIDVDGVQYEWDKTARYLMRVYRGHPVLGPMGRESTSWDYIQQHVSPGDWEWLWTEGVRLGLFRYGHLVQGAVVGLRQLVEEGHRISAVTHRPPSAVRDTVAWLTLLDLPWTGIHILTNQEPKSAVAADVLVDDRIENIQDWEASTGNLGILFGRAWNKDPLGLYFRVTNWDNVVAAIRRYEEGTLHFQETTVGRNLHAEPTI